MVGRAVARRGSVVVASVVVWRGEVPGGGRTQAARPRGAIAGLADGGGVGDNMWTRDGRGLRQLTTASPWSAGPRGGGDRAAAHRTTALSVTSSVGPLAGRPGPVAVVGMPVGVVVAFGAVALLVHGAVMMVVVVVVTAVLGPAAVPLALLGWEVARLRGGAEVCAQARVCISVSGQGSL